MAKGNLARAYQILIDIAQKAAAGTVSEADPATVSTTEPGKNQDQREHSTTARRRGIAGR